MIKSKADYIEYINRDMEFYRNRSRKEMIMDYLTNDPIVYINKYLYYLRKEELYFNTGTSIVHTILYLIYLKRKNSLGNQLGFKIPKNCFGPGLTIYHHGEIIVNENANIGAGCKLHGGNCIGNNGFSEGAPVIGDGLDLGIGAKIIGPISLGNKITVGANAVVVKSFDQDNITLIGIPAKLKEQ